MKFILQILSLSLCIFSTIFSDKIKVGFITTNTEGADFTDEDLVRIPKILSYKLANQDKLLINKEDITNQTEIDINNLDVILISVQEGKVEGLIGSKEKMSLLKMRVNDKWECPKFQIKIGLIKATERAVTQVSVCYKKAKFDVAGKKHKTGKFGDTKESLGYCLSLKSNKNEAFCFLGGHFTLEQDKTANMMNDIIQNLTSLNKDNLVTKIKYTAYITGDLNTRSALPTDNHENLKRFVKNSLQSGKIQVNDENQMNNADETAITKLNDFFKSKNTGFNLHFCGNTSLRKLPYTYKYLKPRNHGNQVVFEDFDNVNMVATKSPYKGGNPVPNIGWLDRLVCLSKENNCKISGGVDSVKYSVVPFLRLGDHMPVVGTFEIDTNSRRRRRRIRRMH
jgi:hypothetical protein